jgi:tRNA modification GTPase
MGGDRLPKLILIINKIDLATCEIPLPDGLAIDRIVKTAASQNLGIDELEQSIMEIAQTGKLQAANLDLAINQRQSAALTQTQQALRQVQITIAQQLPLDFWTIDLRSAIQALGEITGEDITESVLNQIFSRFCIGK